MPPPPAQPALEDLEILIQALVRLSGIILGQSGTPLERHLSDVKNHADGLARVLQTEADDSELRQLALIEVDRLIDAVAKTGDAVGKRRVQFRGVELAQIVDGLRLCSQWLHDPSDAQQTKIETFVASLHATMGITPDPEDQEREEREDRERAEDIKQTVRASLDKIFGDEFKI